MAGTPCIVAEIATGSTTLYFGTHAFITRGADTPANTAFEPRMMENVGFSRSVDTVFWGGRPRGSQSFGQIVMANADGRFDTYVARSLRDKGIVLKRGNTLDAYSSFSTVANLIIDRIEFTDEKTITIVTKDISAKLERSLQLSLYPSTSGNLAVRGRPRPVTVGRCYQVPVVQPILYGNGQYDVHDGYYFAGVEQYMDKGSTILDVSHPVATGTGYRRSHRDGIYGVERTSGVLGKQVATVLGALKLNSTLITEDFANLTNFTEINGGVANRDASISSNRLLLTNTAGGAQLSLEHNTTITPADSWRSMFFYEFDVTQVFSGYARFRITGLTTGSMNMAEAGHFTGLLQYTAAFKVRFSEPDGSNGSMLIDTFRVYSVTPIEQLSDFFTYLCTNDASTNGKGPLTTSDLDTTTIAALQTAAPYYLGLHAQDPIQIAECLDQVMMSFGGWWYVNRSGLVTAGRLLAPTGTAAYTFDKTNIAPGMKVEFDEAPGLSNLILAKRNWSPYAESEIDAGLNYVQLNSADKDADVTLSGDNYNYAITNAGSVRNTPLFFGDRAYFEVTLTSNPTAGGFGFGNASALITNYPGIDNNALSYINLGQINQNNASILGGLSTFTSGDVIGIAIDGRPMARGNSPVAVAFYARKNGTWQNSANPDTDTQTVLSNADVTYGIAYVMIGESGASTSNGTVNFGQTAFTYDAPDDFIAPAWHRSLIQQEFRYSYESTVSLHASYTHADSNGGEGGIPTLISKAANARTECDRWATMYASERFFYTFDVFLDSVAADQIEPGAVIEVTYPRYGLSSKKLVVVGVQGRLLDRRVTIKAWG